MPFRFIDRECYASGDLNLFLLLIQFAFSVTYYIAASFGNIPSLEIMLEILRSISHADFVIHSCAGILICTYVHLILAQGRIALIQEGYLVKIENHGIVSDCFAFRYTGIYFCLYSISNTCYRLRCCILVIIWIICPSKENLSTFKCSSARIINDGVEIITYVCFLYIDSNRFSATLYKINSQSGVIFCCTGIYYSINRKLVRPESCIASTDISAYRFGCPAIRNMHN